MSRTILMVKSHLEFSSFFNSTYSKLKTVKRALSSKRSYADLVSFSPVVPTAIFALLAALCRSPA